MYMCHVSSAAGASAAPLLVSDHELIMTMSSGGVRRWWETTGFDGSGIVEKARTLASADLVAEEASRGWLPPCAVVSPLGGGGYSAEEVSQ